MKKSISGIIVLAVILILGTIYAFSQAGNNEDSLADENDSGTDSAQIQTIVESSGNNSENSKTWTVKITNSGFEPQKLEINNGDSITLINERTNPSWPASNMHPTHIIYPGSDIKKCETSEKDGIFDSCRGLEKGESWTFKFTQKGSWGYHDHLDSGERGTIVVN